MKIEELKAAIKTAKAELSAAHKALNDFESLAENNVFESLEKAEVLEDTLRGRASDDCEGSYNCGLEKYTQEFMVDGVVYVATLTVEYGRHDKTYYFIDESEFSINAKATGVQA